jgi:hypothetical protein
VAALAVPLIEADGNASLPTEPMILRRNSFPVIDQVT